MTSKPNIWLKHCYGWSPFHVKGKTVAQRAYAAVRATHHFLTDDNHTHKAGPKTLMWGGERMRWSSVTIFKNAKSPDYPAWIGGLESGPGGYWFAVTYRGTNPKTL